MNHLPFQNVSDCQCLDPQTLRIDVMNLINVIRLLVVNVMTRKIPIEKKVHRLVLGSGAMRLQRDASLQRLMKAQLVVRLSIKEILMQWKWPN
jgi:hypothetical protein